MSLASGVRDLATYLGLVVHSITNVLTVLQDKALSQDSRLYAVEATAGAALSRTANTAQTVAGPVDYAALTINGANIATTSTSQTLSAKTLTTPVFNGWRQITVLFQSSGDVLVNTSIVMLQSTTGLAIRLPSVTGNTGYTVTIKNVLSTAPGAAHVISSRSPATIDGQASVSITTGYGWVTLYCTSSNWFVIGRG